MPDDDTKRHKRINALDLFALSTSLAPPGTCLTKIAKYARKMHKFTDFCGRAGIGAIDTKKSISNGRTYPIAIIASYCLMDSYDNGMYTFYVRCYSDLTSSKSHHKRCEHILEGMCRHDHANRWLTFATSFVGSFTVRAYTSVICCVDLRKDWRIPSSLIRRNLSG
jgi:hypothetical protein